MPVDGEGDDTVTSMLWKTWFDAVNGLIGAAAPAGAAKVAGEPSSGAEQPQPDAFALMGMTLEQYQRAAQPWAELTKRYLGFATSMPGAGADPLADLFERSFGLLVNFPGIERELPTLMREGAFTWAALMQALAAYNATLMPTWLRTSEEIAREVQRRRAAGDPVETAGAFLAVATAVSDRVLVETFRSDEYVQAHRSLFDAIAKARLNQNRLADLFARDGHFPTRRELDGVLREIADLRRELRTIRRRVSENNAHGQPALAAASPSADSELDFS